MHISFVIYFHSSRLDNLKQTIRFLQARELSLYGSELILVCHDSCDNISSEFFVIKQYNLNVANYNKAKFCNYGVSLANNDIIALLDSDRVLPTNYFGDIVQNIKKGQFITTEYLYSLDKHYSDEAIQSNQVIKKADFRSTINASRRKNLFSGNAVFYKQDYCEMNELFEGYGFVDNYQTHNVIKHGYQPIYLKQEELHLFHIKEVYWNSQKLSSFKILSAINAIKYFRHWRLEIDEESINLINDVRENLHLFPDELINTFKQLDTRKFL